MDAPPRPGEAPKQATPPECVAWGPWVRELPRALSAALARQDMRARLTLSAFEALARLVRPSQATPRKRVLIIMEPERDRAAVSRVCSAVAMHAPGAVLWAYSSGEGAGTLRAMALQEWIRDDGRAGFAGVRGDDGPRRSVQRATTVMIEPRRVGSSTPHGPALRLAGEGPLAPAAKDDAEGASGPELDASGVLGKDAPSLRELLSEEELAMLLGDSAPPSRPSRGVDGGR